MERLRYTVGTGGEWERRYCKRESGGRCLSLRFTESVCLDCQAEGCMCVRACVRVCVCARVKGVFHKEHLDFSHAPVNVLTGSDYSTPLE